MMRPLQNLRGQNLALMEQYQELFENYISSGNYVSGALTEKFEHELAAYTGCESALEIALRAAGVKPGDFVGIPALTFVATAFAVKLIGAKAVLIDIDKHSWNISMDTVSEAYEKHNFSFLVPVHLHGNIIHQNEFQDFVTRKNIIIVEDAAQSISRPSNKTLLLKGSEVAATSFYPGKNLGSITEGGAILTNSRKIMEYAKKYRNWGTVIKYEHDSPGGNFRIDEFGSGVLSIKLEHFLEVRKFAAYFQVFSGQIHM